MALLLERGFRVTGVDVDTAMLAEAERMTRGAARLLSGCAEALPLPDNSQELVLCECVLSLCAEPKRAVSEFFRVLAPGGSLIVTDIIRHDDVIPGIPGMKSCLAGAVPLPHLREILHCAGFQIKNEEQHDRKLAELGARLILGGESLDGLGRWLGFECGGGPSSRDLLRVLGYVLLTCCKEGV